MKKLQVIVWSSELENPQNKIADGLDDKNLLSLFSVWLGPAVLNLDYANPGGYARY
jgi:hypothetical protein